MIICFFISIILNSCKLHVILRIKAKIHFEFKQFTFKAQEKPAFFFKISRGRMAQDAPTNSRLRRSRVPSMIHQCWSNAPLDSKSWLRAWNCLFTRDNLCLFLPQIPVKPGLNGSVRPCVDVIPVVLRSIYAIDWETRSRLHEHQFRFRRTKPGPHWWEANAPFKDALSSSSASRGIPYTNVCTRWNYVCMSCQSHITRMPSSYLILRAVLKNEANSVTWPLPIFVHVP